MNMIRLVIYAQVLFEMLPMQVRILINLITKSRNIFKKAIRRSDRIFKEIEKKKWVMFTLCYVFGQLSSVKCLA